MVSRYDLETYLDDLMHPEQFEDYAPNGLQVEGKMEIRKLALATSATLNVVNEAIARKADGLLVHHGWLWKNQDPRITGPMKMRLELLLNNEINLFAYHLPMDALENMGNNHPVLVDLDAQEIELFSEIGYRGHLNDPMAPEDFFDWLDDYYSTTGTHIKPQNLDSIQNVVVVSGAGQSFFRTAIAQNESAAVAGKGRFVDAFVTGEGTEWVYPLSIEHNVAYSAMGHYSSEEIGPRLLATHLSERFDLETFFITEENPF